MCVDFTLTDDDLFPIKNKMLNIENEASQWLFFIKNWTNVINVNDAVLRLHESFIWPQYVGLSGAPTAHDEYCSRCAATSQSSGPERLQLRPPGGAREDLLHVAVYDLHTAVASSLLPGDSIIVIVISISSSSISRSISSSSSSISRINTLINKCFVQ